MEGERSDFDPGDFLTVRIGEKLAARPELLFSIKQQQNVTSKGQHKLAFYLEGLSIYM